MSKELKILTPLLLSVSLACAGEATLPAANISLRADAHTSGGQTDVTVEGFFGRAGGFSASLQSYPNVFSGDVVGLNEWYETTDTHGFIVTTTNGWPSLETFSH